MGNNSSRTDEEDSSQQAQRGFVPQSHVPTIARNQPNQISDNLPHNYEAIIQDSDMSVDKSSPNKLLQQLQSGVFLNGQTMKYWVTRENINCFKVFAKGLKITWGEDMRYWVFQNMETSDGQISVALLRNVCWLEIHGRLHTKYLTPGVKYQVSYVIKLEENCYGWQIPVNFRLTFPNGTKQEHKENLNRRPREEWVRIPVGEFEAPIESPGEIEFSLYECEGGNWKKGLIIGGVSIEPKI